MVSNREKQDFLWWQEGIIYQIYPRSFQDSNADGTGDLRGILQRLDYLVWLGVNIIWLSPIYPSPMKDFGYDISDYTDIHPIFGSMADFNELLDEVHKRGMKLVIDLVPNHTSDQHPWFLESRSSKTSKKRDWYIWHDGTDDKDVPNNWRSVFGGAAWEWDEPTGQYYYHAFLKEQPDLNWRNPEVREAMNDVMHFWLKKGVDGFRVDVIWHLIKDKHLRDNPPNPDYLKHMLPYDELLPVFSTDQPEVHEIVQSMRKVLDEYNERMMIGEVYLPIHKLVTYYGADNNGAHLPFNFLLVLTEWNATKIAAVIDEYEGALPAGGWPNWVLGNHDQPRIRSRVGHAQSRIAAMLLLTLRGTPTLYYGDEIGMRDVAIPDNEIQDPQGLNLPGKNLSRDPARTPMQWDTTSNAGFTGVRPWLRIDIAYIRDNVELQKNDPYSILSLYKKLIDLRTAQRALKTGYYKLVCVNERGFAFTRGVDKDEYLIALNFSHRPCYFKFKNQFNGTVVVATAPELEGMNVSDTLNLNGDEGVIIKLK